MTTQAPCGWTLQPCGPLPAEDDPAYEAITSAAADVLWALSGRRFGCCERTVRPCRRSCAEQAHGWPHAYLDAGSWVNASCMACGSECGCSLISELFLPGPVCSIVDVVVDGVSVTGAARVDDQTWLVRTDGGRWPTCQDMAAPLGDPGTFSVTYTVGTPLPPAGQRAFGEMSSELWKACGGDDSCCLPKRVQSVVRRGISFAMLDHMEFLKDGRTGLYFTDLWLASVNPLSRPEAARVISPDSPTYRSQSWP